LNPVAAQNRPADNHARIEGKIMRASWISGALLLLAATTCVHAQGARDDTISADIAMREIRAIGWEASVFEDASHNPRIDTQVARHNWAIVLRDCAGGAVEQRRCQSLQFIVDTEMPKPVPGELINKWNKEYRYARASLQQGNQIGCSRSGACTAHIVVDVLIAGTKGDPAKTFHTYFDVVQRRMTSFRKYIGAPE